MPGTTMTVRILRSNAAAVALMAFDLAPRWIVRSDLYVRLRRLFSKNPRRFTAPGARELSPDPRQWPGRKLASWDTDLVIEGFPGSGNSYVSNCLRAALDRPLDVESHFHFTAQLKRASSLGVPAVVIVRKPVDAWSSLKSKEPELFDGLIALRWILYHTYVLRNLQGLHVFFFDEVIADVDAVRTSCEEVRRLVSRPIEPVSSYRRASGRRTGIDVTRITIRLLRKISERIFAEIEARRGRGGRTLRSSKTSPATSGSAPGTGSID